MLPWVLMLLDFSHMYSDSRVLVPSLDAALAHSLQGSGNNALRCNLCHHDQAVSEPQQLHTPWGPRLVGSYQGAKSERFF